MPTYEYACPRGHRFERFVRKISDADPSPACPTCGARAQRLISGAGLIFKGSGFYITDYGKDGKKQQAPALGDGAKSDAAKGSDAASSGTAGNAPPPKSEGQRDGAAGPSTSVPKKESKPASKKSKESE